MPHVGMIKFDRLFMCLLFFCSHLLLCLHHREIDKDEFRKVMTLMRSYNRQGAAHRDGLRFGRKVCQPVEDGGLVEYFFGKDGNEHLHYDKFSSFLKQLHDEVIFFSFFCSLIYYQSR